MTNQIVIYDIEGNQHSHIHPNQVGYLLRKQKAVLLSNEPMIVELVPESIEFDSKQAYKNLF